MSVKTTIDRDDRGVITITQERKISGLGIVDTMTMLPSDFVKIVKSLAARDGEMRVALGLADAEEISHVKTNGLVR
jgi:hypothetical protein